MHPELWGLFTRPFWLDEWHTNLVANRESIAQLFSDLNNGSDFGPPLVHLLGWTIARVSGGEVTPVGARIAAFLSVLFALVFVFIVLRRRFGVLPATAGTVAVVSHPLVFTHAFELRFYCLWLFAAAGFAWALGLDGDKRLSRRRDVLVAVFSVLLPMTHWLAVLSLGLMGVGAMAAHGREWRVGLRRVVPAVAGFVVLAIASPLVFGQRRSITERSWMPDLNLGDVLSMLDSLWAARILIFAVVVILTAVVISDTKQHMRTALAASARDPAIIALMALFLLPLLLVVVSLRQPALHDRYSITVLLARAPVVALAVYALGLPVARLALRVPMRIVQAGLLVILLLYLRFTVLVTAGNAAQFTQHAVSGKRAYQEACKRNVPVVFEVRHLMYPATDGMSKRNASCDTRYLAISSPTLERMFGRQIYLPRFFRIENEFAVLHQRLYDGFTVGTQAQLDTTRRFVLVAWDESLPLGYKDVAKFGAAVFPNHRVTRINADLALFERQ
jgi:hypothetical protein